MHRLELGERSLDSLDGECMRVRTSGNDALVALECPPQGEVEWLAVHIRADTTRLLDQKRARRMVLQSQILVRRVAPTCPNLFLVLLAARVLCRDPETERA